MSDARWSIRQPHNLGARNGRMCGRGEAGGGKVAAPGPGQARIILEYPDSPRGILEDGGRVVKPIARCEPQWHFQVAEKRSASPPAPPLQGRLSAGRPSS